MSISYPALIPQSQCSNYYVIENKAFSKKKEKKKVLSTHLFERSPRTASSPVDNHDCEY
jgi:hypothetical protein